MNKLRLQTIPGTGSRRPHWPARYGHVAYRVAAAGLFAAALAATPAHADKIAHPTAIFAGLDKITGRIISFEVAINETVQFGSLHITPRICYTRPPTEAPQTTSFVEVEEILPDEKFKKLFTGWMFAASPGLHGIEHPVYDAWLTDCKGGTKVIKTAKPKAEDEPPPVPAREEPDTAERSKPSREPDNGDEPSQRADQPRTLQPRVERRAAPPPPPRARRRPSQSFFPTNRRPGRLPIDENPFGGD